MKRKITLLVALVAGINLMLAIFSQNVSAQQGRTYTADTGVVTLGQNQKLRVIVTPANDNEAVSFRFRRCTYTTGSDGLLSVSSTQISPVMTLDSDQARFFDILGGDLPANLVRARVFSRRPDFIVNFQIISMITGEVQTNLTYEIKLTNA